MQYTVYHDPIDPVVYNAQRAARCAAERKLSEQAAQVPSVRDVLRRRGNTLMLLQSGALLECQVMLATTEKVCVKNVDGARWMDVADIVSAELV